jgi:hypothetical protein
MAFDAGTIMGKLGLNVSEFIEAIDHAKEEAGEKSREIGETIGQLGEIAGSMLGGAGGEILQGLGGMLEGLASGNAMEVLQAMIETVKGVVEGVEEVGESFHEVALAAEKTGTSVKWMSEMSGVASLANVGVEQFAQGLAMLEVRASNALQGDKGAIRAFERLNITMADLGKMQDSPQQLFESVKNAIDGLATSQEKLGAARAVMSRAGISMVPILTMEREEMDRVIQTQDAFGATVTAQSAEMGKAMSLFKKEVHDAMTGIEYALAMPVLQFLNDHMKEITPKLVSFTKDLKEGFVALQPVFEAVKFAVEPLVLVFEGLWQVIKAIGEAAGWAGGKLGEFAALQNLNTEASAGVNGGVQYNTVNLNYDPKESVSQLAARMKAGMDAHAARSEQRMQGQLQAALVEQSTASGGEF